MANRHIISYSLFVLGVILLVLVGLVGQEWLSGILLGLAFLIGGAVLYRRGK